ncbi:hypothetical protein [Occallatibacter savannae]|uniref:hypothetical protein n=1 Tax=Occallatibacter savannae TaxID=1002691 RepID=UPI0019524CCD|nr:hypothetical protein [Occallatibacter savannae]
MKSSRLLALALFALLSFGASAVRAQVNISVNIGPEPVCPYGYYNYAPYNCAPFGYYGPTWFTGGVFFGAGPWFHGPVGFRGYIDRTYDPRFGYHGPFPVRGEHADWGRHRGWEKQFRGHEYREEYRHDNGNHYGQYKDHDDRGRGHDRDDHGHGNGHGHDHDDHGHGHGHDRD